MSTPLPIAIVSDIVCPWCYIGRARLMLALDQSGLKERAIISWRPYELNPEMPEEGIARTVYLDAKFGADRRKEMELALDQAAEGLGLRFDWDKIITQPNTRKAHQFLAAANLAGRFEESALGDAAALALFEAYFVSGRDIGNRAVLLEIAESIGLDVPFVEGAIDDPELASAIADQELEAHNAGIDGIPFFLLFNKYALSGAQPPETWHEIFKELADKGILSGK